VNRSSPRCISSLALAGCLLLLSSGASGAPAEVTKYTETHGALVSTVQYSVVREAQAVNLTSSGGSSQDSILWLLGSGTVDWRMTDAAAGSDLHAQRSGDVIHVTGTLKNKPVQKDVTVDPAPWYQVFGPLLDQLLPAGSDQKEFWVVDPSDLAPHKMQVRRAGSERITVKGTAMEALKIHFSPAGGLAPFWGADFWYRQSDGLYVSSRLPERGAVTVTTIEDLPQ
jgi:hypothetical protein